MGERRLCFRDALDLLTNRDLAPIIYSFLTCQDIALGVARTCQSLHRDLSSERGFALLCRIISGSHGLYVPIHYLHGHKKLFFDQLWPARFKWQPPAHGEQVSRNFQLSVSIRFKPQSEPTDSDQHPRSVAAFIPLHQRLALVKQGKLSRDTLKRRHQLPKRSSSEPPANATESAENEKLLLSLAEGKQLPPELLAAVMEAMHLDANRRNLTADQLRQRQWDLPEAGSSGTIEEHRLRRGDAHESADAAESKLLPHTPEDMDGYDDDDDSEIGNPLHGPRGASRNASSRRPQLPSIARVLAVQPTRVLVYAQGVGLRQFHFPTVLDQAPQAAVYEHSIRDSVLAALNGFNACLFCYGQTSSGKTHTVFGPLGSMEALERTFSQRPPLRVQAAQLRHRGGGRLDGVHRAELREAAKLPEGAEDLGAVPRVCWELLLARHHIAAMLPPFVTIAISAQYVQIYQGVISDLLSGRKVLLRDRGAHHRGHDRYALEGATSTSLDDMSDVVAMLQSGERWKHYAATNMNTRSSRAHTVIILTLTQTNSAVSPAATLTSCLQVLDLAGCEALSKSGATGQRLNEAVGINSSLLVLGKCVEALVQGKQHVPYFESRLTMLLKAALGGNSRTTAVITCSRDPEHGEETLRALRFGSRCAMVTNQISNQLETMSVDAALEAIDASLHSCQRHMRQLEARGHTQQPTYAQLVQRFASLSAKRREFIDLQLA